MDVAFLAYKSLSDISKIEPFNGSHFKRWQEKVTDTPDVLNFVDYLTQTKPEKNPEKPEENYAELLEAWNKRNKVCHHTILSTLSNELYDVYCTYKTASEIWEELKRKYMVEDAGSQKYAIGNFLDFKMVDDKEVSAQIHDFHMLINDLKTEEIILPKPFVAESSSSSPLTNPKINPRIIITTTKEMTKKETETETTKSTAEGDDDDEDGEDDDEGRDGRRRRKG
ncbi:hypothetical protein Q3G72_015767 [Acer saccharum]|nr:hypothetical protein Q3G72_015767 [Acer saccharum]